MTRNYLENLKLSHLDPRTNQCELEIQNIIHLQNIANQLPDIFTTNKKMVKSHILTANAPSRIKIPKRKKGNIVANESISRLKRGRPVGAKDKNHRKWKLQQIDDDTPKDFSFIKQAINIVSKSSSNIDPPEEGPPKEAFLEEIQVSRNNKISINYVHIWEILDRNKIIINDIFAFKVAFGITKSDEIEP